MKEIVKLGQKVKCKVTGLTGIVDHIATYAAGCRRIAIQPTLKKDGTMPEAIFIDEPQIEIIDTKQIIKANVLEPRFAFGQKVKCPITEFVGKITGRAIYLNGCSRVELTGIFNEKLGHSMNTWIAEELVEPIGKVTPIVKEERKTGGTCSGSSRLSRHL